MIVHPKPKLSDILFSLKGSIAKRIALRSLMVTALASLIVLIEVLYPALFSRVNATPFTLLGISLSIFMSFRNNACYGRWWEGRQAWGKVMIEMRSFARASIAITEPAKREAMLRELCGYAHALNARLRGENEQHAASPWVSNIPGIYGQNISDGILRNISRQCSELAESNAISDWRYITLEKCLYGLSEAQATCERIKGTPLPFPYTLLLHRTIYIFCLLLPFAMAEPLGWLAPVFTTIVSYTFFGLDAIGDELEDPFGRDENDLPTDAFVRTIERDLLDALGHTDLPAPLAPVDYVLN
ncbi:bestrophin family protein [Photobacterium galatheae]|uniref:Bestrophin n=1 Tax=Photobacterium galatheae TaxID=1654360 RepID=A0A066RS78_9GAMM|nr:bestrophin family protein [Photobacterium galatheae]KDM90557.1 bestrophin [Photobacterium galatheae]MCM0148080.1 bestrophin family protein [Photobacterium galatheae]